MNYVIYRQFDGGVDYVPAKNWDLWLLDFPDQADREVCRVETVAEAINLTMLANNPEGESEVRT